MPMAFWKDVMFLMGLKDSNYKKRYPNVLMCWTSTKLIKFLNYWSLKQILGEKINSVFFHPFHPVAPSEALLSCGLRRIRKWAVGKSFSSWFTQLKSSPQVNHFHHKSNKCDSIFSIVSPTRSITEQKTPVTIYPSSFCGTQELQALHQPVEPPYLWKPLRWFSSKTKESI